MPRRARQARVVRDHRRPHARRPDDRRGDELRAVARDHAVLVGRRDERVGTDVDAEPLELVPRVPRQSVPERREQAITALEQDDAHVRRRELRVFVRKDQPHELGERARVLHPGRPAPDDAERQAAAALIGLGRRRGALETIEHVVAELQRLAEILQSERVLRDRIVAVVVGRAAGREHELVVRQGRAVGEPHLLFGEVDVDHVALAVPDVGRVAEHLAHGCGDLGRVQQAARDLVQERREEVVVLPVDDA